MEDQEKMTLHSNPDLPEGTGERPLVTFALFAYNQEKYIREAIEGAFSQTYSPLEIILSDDCSSDQTFKIMKEMADAYKGPHRVSARKNNKNLGLAQHINVIVSESASEFICWAAGDDISLPHRTVKLVTPMLSADHVFGTHSGAIHIDLNSVTLDVAQIPEAKKNITIDSVCDAGESVVSQSHAFRKAIFNEFGPLDASVTNEGPVMSFRELLLGEIHFVDEPLIYYRRGSGVSTQSPAVDQSTRILEATKVARWRATSFRQMLNDSLRYENRLSRKNQRRIRINQMYYSNLLRINEGLGCFRPLLGNFFLKPLKLESVTAIARTKLPSALYQCIIKLRRI